MTLNVNFASFRFRYRWHSEAFELNRTVMLTHDVSAAGSFLSNLRVNLTLASIFKLHVDEFVAICDQDKVESSMEAGNNWT